MPLARWSRSISETVAMTAGSRCAGGPSRSGFFRSGDWPVEVGQTATGVKCMRRTVYAGVFHGQQPLSSRGCYRLSLVALNQLRAFLGGGADRLVHGRGAANAMSQAAVSELVRRLEQEHDVALFQRGRPPVWC